MVGRMRNPSSPLCGLGGVEGGLVRPLLCCNFGGLFGVMGLKIATLGVGELGWSFLVNASYD